MKELFLRVALTASAAVVWAWSWPTSAPNRDTNTSKTSCFWRPTSG